MGIETGNLIRHANTVGANGRGYKGTGSLLPLDTPYQHLWCKAILQVHHTTALRCYISRHCFMMYWSQFGIIDHYYHYYYYYHRHHHHQKFGIIDHYYYYYHRHHHHQKFTPRKRNRRHRKLNAK